ncbi:hypothetical protein, partial [Rhizomonospora bruguierae]|uniref:hypothetical protein n=1 Tax=Rhizomonospora bruguierae TaxID=1581705 RepID=UPI001BD04AED
CHDSVCDQVEGTGRMGLQLIILTRQIDDTRSRSFRELHPSLIMDVMPKRLWTAPALVLIIIASLIMIFSGSLDGAAAWANIIALPVATIGTYLTLRGSAPVSDRKISM